MSLFDTDHIVMRPEDITAGPQASMGEAFSQMLEQQFRVDSQQALQEEIQNRWLENLDAFEIKTGRRFEAPPTLSGYTRYLDNIEGREPGFLDQADLEQAAGVKRLAEADIAIRQLGDPTIKTFADIVNEVYAMQRKVEGETANVQARSGTLASIAGFGGAMVGSFSFRDPINVISLPVGGGGRSIAMRIASEMAVGAASVAATDAAFVLPNRARAGLPERSLLYDIAAGAIGAGVLRGGFEALAAGGRALRGKNDIVLDFNDDQLRQMFENNANSPKARAGEAVLDDIQAIEKSNPYGVGDAANIRFLTELQEVAEAISGVPQTAVARVLPAVPYEHIELVADFALVKEQAPKTWAKLEEAQAAVAALDEEIVTTTQAMKEKTIVDAVRLVDPEAADKLDELAARVNDPNQPEPARAAADLEAQAIIKRVGEERIARVLGQQEQPTRRRLQRARAERRAANRRYREAYKAVEAEAAEMRKFQEAIKSREQGQAVDALGAVTGGRTFTGPILRYDAVEARVAEINKANEILADPETVRMTLDEETNTVDVEGTLMPADFVVPFDEGEMSVRAVMDDFMEDKKLEDAVKSCAI